MQDRQFQDGPLVPVKYTIREQMQRIGDPATTTYPFSARYAYHANGTVSESEFYNAGAPVTEKRYRYVFGTSSYDALNRLKSADYSHYNGGWLTTSAYDLAGIAYDAAGNITALQRFRQNATLIDNLTYSYAGSSNRLSSVADAINTTSETWDAEDGSFTYDANGNMKTAPAPYAVTAVTYDHQNLPVSLTRSGTTTTYRCNEAGQRITKQVGSGSTEVYLLQGAWTLGVYVLAGGRWWAGSRTEMTFLQEALLAALISTKLLDGPGRPVCISTDLLHPTAVHFISSIRAMSLRSRSLTILFTSTPLCLALRARYSRTSSSRYTGTLSVALGR